MRKFLIVVVIIMLIFVVAALFMQTSEIVVEGNSRYSAEEIIAASQLKAEGIIFLADTSGAAKRITDAFPYIESVKVLPKPPNAIKISVTESEPVAHITCADGTIAVLAMNGRVLEINPAEPVGLLLTGIIPATASVGTDESLTGISQVDSLLGVEESFAKGLELTKEDLQALRYALEIIAELHNLDLIRYVSYLQASVLNPQFDMTKAYIIDMGSREETAKKLEYLQRVLLNLDAGSVGTIDLSVLGEAHFIPH